MQEKRFEELKISVEEFKGGDIVLQRTGYQTYTIDKFGQTCFHKHKFMDVCFSDGITVRLYLDQVVGKRTVLRRTN